MTYEEYKTRKAELEDRLDSLKIDYLEEHGFALGTPVIFLGNDGYDAKSVGKLHHVYRREIGHDGDINHTIVTAKKDGSPAQKGTFVCFCYKQHLQVQP